MKRTVVAVWALCMSGALAAEPAAVDTRPPFAPDIREDESELKLQRGNLVVVPIPISNPTLDTGLVAGAAYFYGQTMEQQAAQPASLTALGGMVTNNDSRAFVIAQQNYWGRNRWRFTGAAGAADLTLTLPLSDGAGGVTDTTWNIDGAFLFAKVATRLWKDWYGGFQVRGISADQSFAARASSGEPPVDPGFDVDPSVNSAGVGALFEYDDRDMPINTYRGRYFRLGVLFNDEGLGSDATYQNYAAEFRSFHTVSPDLVFAWEVDGCLRAGRVPLWDACMIALRGFPVTDYIGQSSLSAQAELRWRFAGRWGLAGFAGVGQTGRDFEDFQDEAAIPSYGIGLRYMVLPAKRVNLRVDFARSRDSEAVHVSVGEAF